MTNRSVFPTAVDQFQYLSEVLASDKPNIDRYKVLLMQETRTTEEETELTNLKTTLYTAGKLVSSESFNTIFDCMTNLEDYFLNRVMVDLAALDVGALSTHLGDISNLSTTDKANVVNAVNEVQTETDSAHTKIGNLPTLTTTQKGSLVGAVNELDGNLDNHLIDIDNPHLTSASQVGAYSISQADGKFLNGSGERLELCNAIFFTNGGSDSSIATVSFAKAFATPPMILPANINQSVSYADVILYPYIYNVTTTGFTVKINTSGGANLGDQGSPANLFMKFVAIGK